MKQKLNIPRPEPTEEERAICETFARAKWTGKQAELLKDDVQKIVERLGEVRCEAGVLMTAESASYPIPSLAEWNGRIGHLAAQVAAQEKALDNEGRAPADSILELERNKAQLEEMQNITAHLRSFHETETWLREMADFFKAAGVVIKKSSPTVKFYIIKAPPVRPAKPEKATKQPA